MTPHFQTFRLKEVLIQYSHKLKQFFSNVSKIIPSQKYYLIDADVINFFVGSKGK